MGEADWAVPITPVSGVQKGTGWQRVATQALRALRSILSASHST